MLHVLGESLQIAYIGAGARAAEVKVRRGQFRGQRGSARPKRRLLSVSLVATQSLYSDSIAGYQQVDRCGLQERVSVWPPASLLPRPRWRLISVQDARTPVLSRSGALRPLHAKGKPERVCAPKYHAIELGRGRVPRKERSTKRCIAEQRFGIGFAATILNHSAAAAGKIEYL